MPGAFDQVAAEHVGTGGLLHRLEHAGALIGAPILLARDETRRHVNGAARPGSELRGERGGSTVAIPLQPALETGALIFGAIEGELAVRQPLIGGDLSG